MNRASFNRVTLKRVTGTLTILLAAMLLSFGVAADQDSDSKRMDRRTEMGSSQSVGNLHTQVCVAALESRAAMNQKAKELGVSRRDLKKLECNGIPAARFARIYDIDESAELIITTVQ